MKFIIPSALAAALLSPASATCAIRGNNAAATIMTSTGSCFPGPTGGDSSSSDSCNDLRQAASFCRTYININYSSWCSGAPSMKTLQGRCKNAVRYLEDGKQTDLGSTGFASAEELVDVDLVASYFVCSLTRPSPSRRPEDSGAEVEADCECEGNSNSTPQSSSAPVRLNLVPLHCLSILLTPTRPLL